MFKITISQVGNSEEEEVIIKCREINDEVMSIVNNLKKSESVLLGSKDGEVFRLGVKEIYYIESVDNKTFICMQKSIYESKLRLYEIEALLLGTKFFRCAKSMILNIAKIRSVAPSVNGRFEAKLINGETVIISRQYVPELKRLLGM